MNKRAEAFKKYLDEKEIKVFQIEEVADDTLNATVFRSNIEVEGNQLPIIIVLDSSIYGMVRVLVAPKALKEENELALCKLVNEYNRSYKSTKYYIDGEGSLILDSCLLFKEGAVDGDMIYLMLDVIINHLQEHYKSLMKAIWG